MRVSGVRKGRGLRAKLDEPLRNVIVEERESRGWSQDDMARLCAMSRGAYAHVESGKTRINMDHLERCARAFRMKASELLQVAEGEVGE